VNLCVYIQASSAHAVAANVIPAVLEVREHTVW